MMVASMLAEHPEAHIEVSEAELEQALPELRLGTLNLVIGEEYDGHHRS